ncbi:MAG: HAD family phosphatase [Oscillospiraceae bacterium]|nr:HAD family phosphatase [Oscillospiraceae bacterium]
MAFQIYRSDQARPVRGVLFDMDGVVLDTEKLYARFWREAAEEQGYTMSYEQALGMRSLNNEAGQAKLEEYFGPGVSRQRFRQIRIRRMDAYTDVYGVDPKPGIFELLDYLDGRGIKKAITTSSPVERVEKYLKPLGLFDRFDCICSGHQVPKGKPEPDIYLYGAACLGLRPEECLALEDSYTGILSAHRAGCMAVMIPDLDQPDERTMKLLLAKADGSMDLIGALELGAKDSGV